MVCLSKRRLYYWIRRGIHQFFQWGGKKVWRRTKKAYAGRNYALDKNVVCGEGDDAHGARSNDWLNSPGTGGGGFCKDRGKLEKREKMGLMKRIHKLSRWGELWNGPSRVEEKKNREVNKIVEIRRRMKEKGGKELTRGTWREVGSKMKRNEIAPRDSAGVYVMPAWIMDEDRPAKRHGIEEMVSSGDASSDTSTDLGDEVLTPWILRSAATLEEYEAQSCGALIRRDYPNL
jgi:hypothetical protein